jgi:hypothetical protein
MKNFIRHLILSIASLADGTRSPAPRPDAPPRVVCVRKAVRGVPVDEWLLQDESHVYIGRAARFPARLKASPWANPFSIAATMRELGEAERGSKAGPPSDAATALCLRRYEGYVRTGKNPLTGRQTPPLLPQLPELAGKVLGCWCPEGTPCHGQVLCRLFLETVAPSGDC